MKIVKEHSSCELLLVASISSFIFHGRRSLVEIGNLGVFFLLRNLFTRKTVFFKNEKGTQKSKVKIRCVPLPFQSFRKGKEKEKKRREYTKEFSN